MTATLEDEQRPSDLPLGSKGRGWLTVALLPSGRPIGIPWMAIKGAEPGPTLTVSCGVHGDEYEGGEAIRRLWADIRPERLTGTLIGVPAVNISAYEAAQRVSPLDSLNLNRVFPGDTTASITGMVARRFFHEIVMKSNYVIDFHAGGNPLSILPIVAFSSGSAASRKLAEQTGADLLWETPVAWSGTLCIAASAAGIPTVMPEFGNDGRLTESFIDLSRMLVMNVMGELGMYGERRPRPARPRVVRGSFVPSSVGGLFRPAVSLGAEVGKGQVVATITDVFGDVLEEIRAPVSGIVCSFRTIPPILPGDQTVFVGEPVP